MPSCLPRKILFFLQVVLISCRAFAQENTPQTAADDFPFKKIELIKAEQGLSGYEVNWIMQDHNGFMWILTDDALNRYDGYSFRSYGYNANDPNTFSSGNFYGLAEDKSGRFWMPSIQQGIYSFDPERE